jgi:hypothetical protein
VPKKAALFGFSPLMGRRALQMAGRFVPISSIKNDVSLSMFVAVITDKTEKRYDEVCA